MDFNSLLSQEGFDLPDVALAMHKPSRPEQRRVLCTLAEEDASAFDAYQSTHPRIQEATAKARRYMASFVNTADGEMSFVGLYENRGHVAVGPGDLEKDSDFVRMFNRINESTSGTPDLSRFVDRRRFDLVLTEALQSLRGRLVVRDPIARNYMRVPERTALEVLEIARVARIVPPIPPWNEVCVMAHELTSLPREWAIQLASWRGIYLIVDQFDGARYVGAAYGVENLLGRWRNHVAGDHGVTLELKRRRSEGFRFTILDLLSPTADTDEVTTCERNWMQRLDTIENGLNS